MSEETFGVESFAAEIEAHVFAEPVQDSVRGRFSVGGRIIDAVRTIVDRIGDGLTNEVKAMLLSAALTVYDKINIPAIPDAIEIPAKTALRPVIEGLLKQLLGIS